MSFKDIKGQSRAVSFLENSIANRRISHAYIFYGPKSVGRKLAAVNFAKALNCLSLSAVPCDSCASCKKIDASSHPDVSVLKVKADSYSIKIDDIRTLIRDIALKPYEARKKVYLIDGANSLTEEAANAILKTLEEPPTDSVLILITERLWGLLPTIVSRSQVVKFFALAVETVKDVLVNHYGIDNTRAHVLACLSSGGIEEALMYQDDKFFEKRRLFIDAIVNKAFFNWDFDRTSREDFKWYLNIMLTWYFDILRYKVGIFSESETVNIDRKDTIKAESKKISFEKLDGAIKQIISTATFLEQNANPKLAMAVLGAMI
ncbi:MAG: DNA polymerase III subunit delta' [Candidatus Omnitrophica bacterium]|nr:DNA polymerase III subunit delta' [Candidatus Omnitrophota bacterium]MCM8790977.1 DNA polymerase III subunit delta' [Candidatus Omnitrophota bacterium]